MIILIVEDDRQHAEQLRGVLEVCAAGVCKALSKKLDITTCYSAKETLYDMEDGRLRPDIIFIATRIGSLSGVEIAGRMRASVPTAQIIFLADPGVYSPEVYEVDHVYLIEKDALSRTIVERALRKAVDRIEEGSAYFECEVNRRRHYIPYQNILYFENIKRKITVHTDLPGEPISFYETMTRLETILPDNFVRCHNSFIVNLDRVSTYGLASVRVDGKEISVSRKYREKLRRMVGL